MKGIGQDYGAGDADAFAIEDLDLSWEDGSANALLGPSGCGKTTLLNMISGLLVPTSGKILLDGNDVTHLDARDRHIAQVFQFPVVYDTMTVFDNLAFPLRNDGVRGGAMTERVNTIAEELSLTDGLKMKASRLSPADKQLVSLGRGIVRPDTAAVLLDEPLTVIDPKRRWHIRRILKKVQRDLGITMIYVTHDQQEALTFADMVTIMRDGAVLQHADPETLYHKPAAPFVGHFIGSPGMNLPEGEWHEGAVRLGDIAIQCDGEFEEGAAVTLGIRPESIDIVDANAADSHAFTIIFTEDHGAYQILTIEHGDISLRVRSTGNDIQALGETIHVRLPEDRVCVFASERAEGAIV